MSKPESSNPPKGVKEIRHQVITKIRQNPKIVGIVIAVSMTLSGIWIYKNWENSRWLTLYGNVDIRESNLGFRVFGKLNQVLKDEGDSVKQGDLLAQLDKAPAEFAREEARGEVASRQAAAASARANFERAESLVGTRGISREEYDTFRSQHDQADAQLKLAEAKLAAMETELNDTQLLSPADGIIITRAQEPGTILQPGTTVLTLSLEKPVWVRAYIGERDLGRVHPGLEVELFTDSRPDRPYKGQVGYISPRSEFTPKSVETTDLRTSLVYRVRITVLDPDPALRQGMPVTVRIQKE